MALPKADYTTIESYAASRPMDRHPCSGSLVTTIDGVRISCMGSDDPRGLLITVEHSKRRIVELSLIRPAAIRNAVYEIVGAMGEPLEFVGVGHDRDLPPWYRFAASNSVGGDQARTN